MTSVNNYGYHTSKRDITGLYHDSPHWQTGLTGCAEIAS